MRKNCVKKSGSSRKAHKPKKQLFLTLITTFGLRHNKYSVGLISSDFDMNVLFEP
jgi:hypothetical protein